MSHAPVWVGLFVIALSLSLLFQSCGGDVPSGTRPDTSDEAAVSQPAADPDEGANNLDALSEEHSDDTPTPTPIAVAEPAQPVTGEMVTYATVDGQTISGYLAQPEADAESPRPAILTIHEWWGLNDNIQAMARRLAGEGYTVLAVDLYGGETTEDPAEARELMRSVMDAPAAAQDNLFQAYEYLTSTLNAPKLGSIGWCFGGNWSLRTGLLLSSDLDAMAIYYGQLILEPEALDALDMPVIGFFGEEDSSIPVIDVNTFDSQLSDLGKTADIHLYPEVGHAFANPSGQNYNAEAAEDAWQKTTAFFAEHLRG